ncbi:DUF4920 domain-containing protein [Psychrosphaera aquimarina]|uniref:DUF4920 domain-containing protein n=1 Tax=Psychrosphaera aquimarina TaxID=2044854 RepID=A0ABU3R1D6_9GAMM|nr:DUF4920 domain-containing protein [Psychrosphaera aquimarina]MDU0113491.1 DUF4920 domain-containing protein [Psychrosphaera aquimarina]
MRFLNTALAVILIVTLSLINVAYAERNFGTGADMTQLAKISSILAAPERYMSSPITVEGAIVKVCSKRGCWMELASDKKFQTLRIKVRDGDMVFPMAAMGKVAYATGQLKALELSLEQSKKYLAYLAQENDEQFDANSVTQAMTIYELSPTGVTIKD